MSCCNLVEFSVVSIFSILSAKRASEAGRRVYRHEHVGERSVRFAQGGLTGHGCPSGMHKRHAAREAPENNREECPVHGHDNNI